MKKQYRISHTEEKISDLLKDANSLNSILSIVKEGCSLKKFLDCYRGINIVSEYSSNSRWGDNLSVIKRLEENQYNAILYLRLNKSDLFDGLDYEDFASIPACVKLYNLVNKGVSKTLDTLLDTGFLAQEQFEKLNVFLSKNKTSIFIEGDLNTGKITLLNALLYKLNQNGSKVVVFDKLSELQLDFLDNKSTVKVLDLEKVTLKEIYDSDGYTVVTTDLSSELFSMFCRVSNVSRVIGIVPALTIKDAGEYVCELQEVYLPRIAITDTDSKNKYLKELI